MDFVVNSETNSNHADKYGNIVDSLDRQNTRTFIRWLMGASSSEVDGGPDVPRCRTCCSSQREEGGKKPAKGGSVSEK
jgi:hypothetical protein